MRSANGVSLTHTKARVYASMDKKLSLSLAKVGDDILFGSAQPERGCHPRAEPIKRRLTGILAIGEHVYSCPYSGAQAKQSCIARVLPYVLVDLAKC